MSGSQSVFANGEAADSAAKSSRAICRSRPPPLRRRIDDLSRHDGVDGFHDRLQFVGRKLLFKLGFDEVALPPGRGDQQNQPVNGNAPRCEDGDQAALAMSGQNHRREFPAAAQIIHERRRIVDKVAEAEIFRPPEFRLPSAGAAFVVTKCRDFARDQLLGELLQRRGFDLRSVAVMVGRSGARDQKYDRWPFHIGRHGQYGVDGADPDLGLVSGCIDGHPGKAEDRERA
jgi:hypothetical protein